MEDISHREIYDKLVAVETKVDTISKDTKDVVNAFNSAKGAFLVFEWIGKLAKQFNVSDATIRKIKRGETWRHVNVRVVDGEDSEPLKPFSVIPTQPRRILA